MSRPKSFLILHNQWQKNCLIVASGHGLTHQGIDTQLRDADGPGIVDFIWLVAAKLPGVAGRVSIVVVEIGVNEELRASPLGVAFNLYALFDLRSVSLQRTAGYLSLAWIATCRTAGDTLTVGFVKLTTVAAAISGAILDRLLSHRFTFLGLASLPVVASV